MTSHADTRSRLAEKVVTVTGGSSGIGAAVARGGRGGRRGRGRATRKTWSRHVVQRQAAFVTGAALAIDGGATA